MFGLIPNIDKCVRRKDARKLIEFLATDKGFHLEREIRRLAFNEATLALFGMPDEVSASRRARAGGWRWKSPTGEMRFRLVLASQGIFDSFAAGADADRQLLSRLVNELAQLSFTKIAAMIQRFLKAVEDDSWRRWGMSNLVAVWKPYKHTRAGTALGHDMLGYLDDEELGELFLDVIPSALLVDIARSLEDEKEFAKLIERLQAHLDHDRYPPPVVKKHLGELANLALSPKSGWQTTLAYRGVSDIILEGNGELLGMLAHFLAPETLLNIVRADDTGACLAAVADGLERLCVSGGKTPAFKERCLLHLLFLQHAHKHRTDGEAVWRALGEKVMAMLESGGNDLFFLLMRNDEDGSLAENLRVHAGQGVLVPIARRFADLAKADKRKWIGEGIPESMHKYRCDRSLYWLGDKSIVYLLLLLDQEKDSRNRDALSSCVFDLVINGTREIQNRLLKELTALQLIGICGPGDTDGNFKALVTLLADTMKGTDSGMARRCVAHLLEIYEHNRANGVGREIRAYDGTEFLANQRHTDNHSDEGHTDFEEGCHVDSYGCGDHTDVRGESSHTDFRELEKDFFHVP